MEVSFRVLRCRISFKSGEAPLIGIVRQFAVQYRLSLVLSRSSTTSTIQQQNDRPR
jgi:hypothetical protein